MPASSPPTLGLGFEFEWWEAALYDDLEDKDYPFKGKRAFEKTGTNTTDSVRKINTKCEHGEILTGNYDENNPAPDCWNPNEGRMPSKDVVDRMLGKLRVTVQDALVLEKRELVSALSVEHPKVDNLVDGVSSAFTKYTAHRDEGRERNLADNPKTWRKDTHVFEQVFYFVALELRTRVYTEANKEDHGNEMRDELKRILDAIPRKHNVSVNAGNAATYRLPDQSVKSGEARAGMHIHVSATGVFDTETQGRTNKVGIMEKRILASKKLLTLYWLIEPNISKLHASWRSADPRYAGLLRRHSNLAFLNLTKNPKDNDNCEHWGQHDEEEKLRKEGRYFYDEAKFEAQGKLYLKDLDSEAQQMYTAVMEQVSRSGGSDYERNMSAIDRIWMCKNMDQLVWLCSSRFGNRRAALSLNQLLPSDSKYQGGGVRKADQRLGTVEFRAMQGSFNYEAVIAWSDVVMRITEVCVTQSTSVFTDTVERLLQAPKPGGDPVKTFIERLDFPKEHRAYKFYNDRLQKEVFDKEANPRSGKSPTLNVFVERK
ncbi:hypothetical protein PGQ11_014891 [Apiospora arundinis]|uniref:Uncharacterized protein n=1 Tax=Apiospora arundinis TaxID=335852 RepID=A0ABR2HJP1_9PEZI